MITVKNLSRNYGNFKALSDVSFEIPNGQIVGLLGHNGAGKTTTLKMLTGVLQPTSGNIDISGLSYPEDRLEIQTKIGYLPENSPTYPDMTVIEYLDYVCELRGLSHQEKEDAIQSSVRKTKLQEKIFEKISTLSKGFKQRVGVAQAILHEPEILILDEPTNGLDPSQIIEMRDLIKTISQTSTVIISTHVLSEVEAICDRVLIILQGKLVKDALLSDLQNSKSVKIISDAQPDELEKTLQEIDEVTSIMRQGSMKGGEGYQISLTEDHPRIFSKIAQTIINKGWSLSQLEQEERQLETIFREINEGVGGYDHE